MKNANNVLPLGPIGFKPHGIGFRNGNPYMRATVGHGGKDYDYTFDRISGYWFTNHSKLNKEEQEMLNHMWEDQCRQLNLNV